MYIAMYNVILKYTIHGVHCIKTVYYKTVVVMQYIL